MSVEKRVRKAVAETLREDADGRSETFKEMWEECTTHDEVNAATTELRRIIAWLEEGVWPYQDVGGVTIITDRE